MKLAISDMNGRIAPVLDYSQKLTIIEINNKNKIENKEIYHLNGDFIQNIKILKDKQIDVLICGAISNQIQQILENENVVLLPWMCGEINEIIEAFIKGKLKKRKFFMPGVYKKK